MTETVYIVFTRNGVDRMTKRQPEFSPSEYPVAVRLTIPDDIFKRRPVPVVEVALKAPHIGASKIIVDGESQDIWPNMDEASQKQATVQREFARMFEAARASVDPAMVAISKVALDALIEAGVEVRITEASTDELTEQTKDR